MSVNFRINLISYFFSQSMNKKLQRFLPWVWHSTGQKLLIFLEKRWPYKFILKFTDLYLILILYARKELAVERFKIIKGILKQNFAFPVYWLLLPLHITLEHLLFISIPMLHLLLVVQDRRTFFRHFYYCHPNMNKGY